MEPTPLEPLAERVERLERELKSLRRDLHRLRGLRLGGLLLIVALIAVGLGYERTRDWWQARRDRQRDHEVLEAALGDVLDPKNPEYENTALERLSSFEIVVDRHPADWEESFASGLPGSDLDGKKGQTIPVELVRDLRRRNTGRHDSLSDFQPNDPRILLRDFRVEFDDLADYRAVESFEKSHPNAMGYIRAYQPGYSQDGRQAVVLLEEGHGLGTHPSAWVLLLKKVGSRWQVRWRHLHHWE